MKFNSTQNDYSNNGCLFLYDMFSLFSLFATAFGIAFSIVGTTLYTHVGEYENFFDDSDADADDDNEESEDDDADDEKEPEEYDHLYYDELDSLEDRVLEKEDLEKLATVVVREKTPNGEVVMTYNHKTESFEYYCDDKNVKYMVLDTVARKFTIDNKCKSICVNYKAEFERAKVAIMADQVTTTSVAATAASANANANANVVNVTAAAEGVLAPVSHAPALEPEPAVPKRSIYAKFKNYNSTGGSKKKEEVSSVEVDANGKATVTKSEKIYILTEKANRFTYKGRVSNYKDPNAVEVTNTVYKKTIDFATFKQTVCNQNKEKEKDV